MVRYDKKNELNFSLILILAYVVLFSTADNLSCSLGTEKIVTAPVSLMFALFIFSFIKKHGLSEYYGLCSFHGKLKDYLYFIPLGLMASVNLWNGITMKVSAWEAVLFIISMISVGFVEEVIFRGFLFKAMLRDKVETAIAVSSITFGMGHIVNLLNGSDFILTLLQLCYASAAGLLFTIIFYKGGSLWPCIITHGTLNSLSVFAVRNSTLHSDILTAILLCVICICSALWILRNTRSAAENRK